MYGMSSKEFWEDDPKLYWAYRTFYLKKLEIEEMQQDYNCWLAGLYNYNATSMAIIGTFGNEESKTKAKYFEQPITLQKKQLEKTQEEHKDANLVVQEQFNKWARF